MKVRYRGWFSADYHNVVVTFYIAAMHSENFPDTSFDVISKNHFTDLFRYNYTEPRLIVTVWIIQIYQTRLNDLRPVFKYIIKFNGIF
jgi:predicted SAM-dependent methyltransferase